MTIDEETLKESALAHVKESISIASIRTRTTSDGVSTDTALYAELEAVARKSLDINMEFQPGLMREYLSTYPEIMYHRSINGTIAESVKAAIIDFIYSDMKADVEELHEAQYETFDDGMVQSWGNKAYRLIREHGDPVSKNMRDLLATNVSEASSYALGEISELLNHLADRVAAHAHYQKDTDKPGYETIARRVLEAREHVWITADRLDKTPNTAPSSPKP